MEEDNDNEEEAEAAKTAVEFNLLVTAFDAWEPWNESERTK
jgi:hypothetical protein